MIKNLDESNFMNIVLFVKNIMRFVLVVCLSGAAYYFANGFHNIWQLMWVAPIPLCLYALNASFSATFFAGFFSFLIGGFADVLVYSHTKIGMSGFAQGAVIQAIAHAILLLVFRYFAIKFKHWSVVFVFAFGWASYEFIVSLFSIHGTDASIAYTQMPNLPIIQIASITGIWGISFLLIFVPSSIVFMWHYRQNKNLIFNAGIITSSILALVLGFGAYQIFMPKSETKIKVGIAAVQLNQAESAAVFTNKDQAIVQNVIRRYEACIKSLAEQGAKVVLLPEEVAYLQKNNLERVIEQFSSAAQSNNVYLIVGLNTKEHEKFYNSAYVFLPDSKMFFRYDKQHLIPFGEELNYTLGNKLEILHTNNFGKLGVAICKDMDFVRPALSYSKLGVGAVFVPAWDFGYDAWIHGRMALMRGVEGNFAVVRAGQDGLLTLSDSRGKIIAQTETRNYSDAAMLVGEVSLGSGNSFYSKFGDWFAWLGIMLLAMMLLNCLQPLLRINRLFQR